MTPYLLRIRFALLMPILSYDFFIPSSKRGLSLDAALEAFLQMAPADRRNDLGLHYFDIVAARRDPVGIRTALIERNRMRNLPPAGDSRTGALVQINIQPHEGVAEVSAFLYDPSLNVLCIQRNSHGITHATFKKLINGATQSDFLLDPVLSEDAMTRLLRLTEHQKFTLKFAMPESPEFFKKEFGGGIGYLTHFMGGVMGTRIKVAVSPSTRGDRLSTNGVWDSISTLLGLGEQEGFKIETLTVKGGTDDGEEEVVDFINSRYRAQSEQEELNDRHTQPEHLRDRIRRAYRESRGYLQCYVQQASAAAQGSGAD